VKVALLGASKGMGRAVARVLAERGDALCLLGRDRAELDRCAADLRVRGAAGDVGVANCDLLEPTTFAPALDGAVRHLGGLDAVVVTAGSSPPRSNSSATRRCAPAPHRRLHQHGPVLRAGARALDDRGRRETPLRLQLGGGRPRPQAGDPLRRRQGRPLALSHRPRPQVRAPTA
jgi:NAD(P)-dependent dehydrogenase (short-subunit alcohol dehydrogenase family)